VHDPICTAGSAGVKSEDFSHHHSARVVPDLAVLRCGLPETIFCGPFELQTRTLLIFSA
jgi:hypothetical protein